MLISKRSLAELVRSVGQVEL